MKTGFDWEVWHAVDASTEDDTKWQVLNDLAYGRVSTLDTEVTQVEESPR